MASVQGGQAKTGGFTPTTGQQRAVSGGTQGHWALQGGPAESHCFRAGFQPRLGHKHSQGVGGVTPLPFLQPTRCRVWSWMVHRDQPRWGSWRETERRLLAASTGRVRGYPLPRHRRQNPPEWLPPPHSYPAKGEGTTGAVTKPTGTSLSKHFSTQPTPLDPLGGWGVNQPTLVGFPRLSHFIYGTALLRDLTSFSN